MWGKACRAVVTLLIFLRLGIALDIPLRERNEMLLAAGYAPAYRERSLSDPALVVDRLWNLKMLNASAATMMRWLLDMPEGASVENRVILSGR